VNDMAPADPVSASTRTPTIVVGVSGSAASAAALRWAAAEAARRHGQLRVVLAWSPERRAAYAPPPHAADPQQQMMRARRVLAAAMQAVLGPMPHDDVTAVIAEGVPERALVEHSAGADLLVLGSASAHALAGATIGPVIRTCLSHAHCPVVVVAPEFPAGHDQPGAGVPRAGQLEAAAAR
jgi:nucleotide-binding universal stress UspA family protein